ncbi:MAG TPA: EF-hand domain-containing protein [Roseomonas sp.]|jgi:hypothetical protein
MTIRLFLAAGVCSALLALPGLAQTPTAPAAAPSPEAAAAARQQARERFFRQYDTDRDGTVTRAEYDAARAAQFRATDSDGNGALAPAEYVAEYEGRLRVDYGTRPLDDAFRRSLEQAARRFRAIDRDQDGSISRAEYDGVASRTFTQTDTNGDGRVDAADAVPPHP